MNLTAGIVKKLRAFLLTHQGDAASALDAAFLLQKLEPRGRIPKEGTTRRQDAAGKRKGKAAVRADNRAEVEARAEGRCERVLGAPGEATEFKRHGAPATSRDHFWGRGRDESVTGSWMLCSACDYAKTNNMPSRLYWLWSFGQHAMALGYRSEVEKVARAMSLEKAQHPHAERRSTNKEATP